MFGLRTPFYFKSTTKVVNVISARIILTSKLKNGVNTAFKSQEYLKQFGYDLKLFVAKCRKCVHFTYFFSLV